MTPGNMRSRAVAALVGSILRERAPASARKATPRQAASGLRQSQLCFALPSGRGLEGTRLEFARAGGREGEGGETFARAGGETTRPRVPEEALDPHLDLCAATVGEAATPGDEEEEDDDEDEEEEEEEKEEGGASLCTARGSACCTGLEEACGDGRRPALRPALRRSTAVEKEHAAAEHAAAEREPAVAEPAVVEAAVVAEAVEAEAVEALAEAAEGGRQAQCRRRSSARPAHPEARCDAATAPAPEPAAAERRRPSRKSVLLRDARRRCGVASPPSAARGPTAGLDGAASGKRRRSSCAPPPPPPALSALKEEEVEVDRAGAGGVRSDGATTGCWPGRDDGRGTLQSWQGAAGDALVEEAEPEAGGQDDSW
jgi:hypothetical protein